MKVDDLTDAKLDYWAGKANGLEPFIYGDKCYIPTGDGVGTLYSPSTDWSQGGPIIERECFQMHPKPKNKPGSPYNRLAFPTQRRGFRSEMGFFGETYLIAAMRAYVASKFGVEVDDS